MERKAEHMMGKVLWHVTMSLDGFIAGPGDAMDWIFKYDSGRIAEVEETLRTLGAVLVGRRSYDVGQRAQRPETRKVYGGAWSGPQFVLTHTAPGVSQDSTITFISGDIRDAVARAREAAAGNNVVVIGASVARQCMDAGLVDEILIHLAPVLLGDGIRFFGKPGGTAIELQPVSVTRSGQLTNLRFRVGAQ
jgi:dihydrofolate reductase